VVPFACFAHKYFTFRQTEGVPGDLRRFVATHFTGLLLSVLIMKVALSGLGVSYGYGIVGAILLVPLVSLVAFDGWVFRSRILLRIADAERSKEKPWP
jgi:GtrA-like protein